MGSDDLFRKRKAREGATLQRQRNERARNKRYLIVCEGTKTEPHYFRELLDELRIRPQLVRIAPNDGVSPDRVVAHALALYENDAVSGDAYDTAYCVFDRDRHATFDAAVQRTKDLSGQRSRWSPSHPRHVLKCGCCFTLATQTSRFIPPVKSRWATRCLQS